MGSISKKSRWSVATSKPQCHVGTSVPTWAGGVKLEAKLKKIGKKHVRKTIKVEF